MDADAGTVNLAWSAALAGDTASHDVYFGTDRTAVAAATRASTLFLGNQTGTSRVVAASNKHATYYWRVDSHGLATRLQRAMIAVSPAESGNRGMVRRRLRLTRNPDIPCVLVELGYLSNASEARLCADPAYRDKMAAAIARAILDQKAQGDAGTGPLPRPINAPPSRPTDAPGS